MSQPTVILGTEDNQAEVTKQGQLIIGAYAYDDTVYKELAEPNTAYNFYAPKPGFKFVITGIVAKADKQVSSTVDADFVIYEASTSSTTTVSKVLFQMAMVEGNLVALMPINILTSEGVYINGKTTDDDFHVTIMGYYIKV